MGTHCTLPYHLYVNVKNSFLGPNMPDGVTRAIWHAIHCRPDQILMCHVLLESGAHWSGLPLHALSNTQDFSITPNTLMPWAAMGEQIQAVHLKYLEGVNANIHKPMQSQGRHTGIMIDWIDGYSRYPEEHKPLNLISLNSGQFALLPNNYTTYTDSHFTDPTKQTDLKHYLRNHKTYWGE